MSKYKIYFEGKCYEYEQNEMYPEVYCDLTDKNLISLFNKRTTSIKSFYDFSNCASVEESNIKLMCEKELEKLYKIEEEIEKYTKEQGIVLDWFSPTNPRIESEVPKYEKQRKFICKNCGEKLDKNYLDHLEDSNYIYDDLERNVCPKCRKENSLLFINEHIYEAETYETRANEKFDSGQFDEGLNFLFEAILELDKVNQSEEDDYLSMLSIRAFYTQRVAQVYVSMNDYTKAYSIINKVIKLWDEAIEKSDIYEFNSVAMGYYIRQCCCLQLEENLESVLTDGQKAEQYLKKYLSISERLHDEPSSEAKLARCKENYEGLTVLVYINMYVAMEALGNPEEQCNDAYNKAIQFLRQSQFIEENDKENFRDMLNIHQRTSDKQQNPPQKEGCYIATAVYGDYDAHPVIVLRRFRDNILQKHSLGRLFVKIYYRLSPPLAEKLHDKIKINNIIRAMLDKFVKHLQERENG
ncbi:CFI-box-CTERM domain-containing protein [Amedibacillus sp. YH-ame10]